MSVKKHISHEKVISVSFLVDISDVLINCFVALISGSVTIYSQALQGAVDLLASGFLYIGMKRAKKRPDITHPYGYGRELYFWAFLSSLVMFGITATLSFYWGLMRVLHPAPITNVLLAYISLFIAVMTNGYAFSLSVRRLLAKNTLKDIITIFFQSSLIETKTTLVLDLMGTLASVLGLIALIIYQLTGDVRFDGVGAMSVGIMLALCAIVILKDVKNLLIGQGASKALRSKIIHSAMSFSEVHSVLDLRTTYVGVEKLFIALEIHLAEHLKTHDIEVLIDKIEAKIKKDVLTAEYISIELEAPN